jgi:hypothetical protein
MRGAEGVGDEGFAVEVVGGVVGFVAGGLLIWEGGVELAGDDFVGGGVDEAEFAGGEVGFAVISRCVHWRAKRSTEDGAMLVEVAGAGGRVEDGTRFVVSELFEEDGGFVVFVEDAGGAVAGEPRVESGEGVGDAGTDTGGSFGVGVVEESEAFAEAGCVLMGDGKDSDAALGAAGVADKVMCAALVGGCGGGFYDLDEGVGRCIHTSRLRDDVVLAEGGEEIEEAFVGGLVVEEA